MDEAERMRLLESLASEHKARLRGYVFSRTADANLVDDIVQEVFMVVLKKIDSLDRSLPAWFWIKGIARNELYKHWRAAGRTSTFEKINALIVERKLADDTDNQMDDLIARMKRCLAKMARKPRSLLTKIYIEGSTTAQVAKAWGSTDAAVRMYLHRLRNILRECVRSPLEEIGYGPSH
jgi:RNA polymerase sigma-70 factor, ECF subfamily